MLQAGIKKAGVRQVDMRPTAGSIYPFDDKKKRRPKKKAADYLGIIAVFNIAFAGGVLLLDVAYFGVLIIWAVLFAGLLAMIGLSMTKSNAKSTSAKVAKQKASKTAEKAPPLTLETAIPRSATPRANARTSIAGKPRTICISNQKGGVGKTTTTLNLAAALAATGEKVLVIDLDPQGNASTGLGIRRSDRKKSSYHLLTGLSDLAETVTETSVPGVSVIPSTVDLAGAELELANMPRRASRLKDALSEASADMNFDYVLIDCPPALGILTINAMSAADALIAPLQCEFFALEGLTTLLRTVDRVQQSFNPSLYIMGVVLTMYDKRNNLSAQVAEDVRSFMGDKVYDTMIPRNVRISEAPSFGVPALVYDAKCPGSLAYARLAEEIVQNEAEAAGSIAA